MRKFLLCSTVIAMFGGVSATDNCLLPEVVDKDSDLMTNFPADVPVLQAGTLEYDAHLYDLICTGNCNLVKKDNMPPDVLHMDKVPSFVEVCKEGENIGEIVFTEPKPMGTVSLPAGHDAYVTISLQKVRSAFEQTNAGKEAVKYVALGVRVQGINHYTSVLRMPLDADDANAADKNVPSVCFHMGTGNVVELVPLLSATDMSGDDGYTVVEPGAVANRWAFLNDTNPMAFNFDSVFRAEVVCSDTVSVDTTNWEDLKWGLGPIYASYSFFYTNGIFWGIQQGFLGISDHATWEIIIEHDFPANRIIYSTSHKKYIAISSVGECYVSEDGKFWNSGEISSIPVVQETIRCAVDLGGKIIVMSIKGNLWMLENSKTTWDSYGQKLADLAFVSQPPDPIYDHLRYVNHLSYGAGVLIAATSNGYISISEDGGNNWSYPEEKLKNLNKENNDNYVTALAFGEGKFLAVDYHSCATLASTDGGKTWHDDDNINIGTGRAIKHLIYGDDAFYAADSGYVYRSPIVDLTNK